MTVPLIILGAGDFAREMHFISKEQQAHPRFKKYQTIAFIDEDPKKTETAIEGIPIKSWGAVNELSPTSVEFICGVGNARTRKLLIDKLHAVKPTASHATIIHRSAVCMPNTHIAAGVFIGPNTTIALGSRIEKYAAINQNVSIGHDCTIREGAVISPGCALSGRTQIGSYAFLGSGAITYPGVSIGSDCRVGANTALAHALADGKKAVTLPEISIS